MNHYELRPGQKIMPQNNKISYMIRSGAAFISMLLAYPDNRIPVKKTIGIAKPGLIIPGFSEDILFEGETLIVHLLIEPKGVAKIEEIPFEENHKTVFLTNIGYDTVNKDSDTSDMYLCLIRDYYTEAANRHDLIKLSQYLELYKNACIFAVYRQSQSNNYCILYELLRVLYHI